MAESSDAGPSSQGQIPLRSLDIERGSAEPRPSRGSRRNEGDASADEEFIHLFISDKNAALIEQMPPGWIKLAAERNLYHNRRTNRRFGTLLQKLVLAGEIYLAAKETEIDQALNSPDGDERFTWADPLLRQTRDDFIVYTNLIKSDDYLRSLREANIHQHVATYQHIRLGHKFSEAKSAHLLRHEDMVQPQTDPTDLIINSLLYGLPQGWIEKWIQGVIYCLFGQGNHGEPEGSRSVNIDHLYYCLALLFIFVGETIIATPVLILYLVPMQKTTTAAVVVAFMVMLTPPVIFITTFTRFGNALFGLAAFMAILATFLAQLDNGGSNSS